MHLDNLGIIAQQIDPWLRKQIVLQDKIHGKCHHILLRHLSVDRKIQGDIASFPVKLEPESEEIDPLVTSICEAAQKDADEIQAGVQNYALYAQFDDLNYMPRKLIRVASANEEFERDLTPSEPATDKGLVAQHMRHTEAFAKIVVTSQSYMADLMRRENQRLSDQNDKYANQQVDFMLTLQKLMDHSHERRLKEKEREFGVALKQEALDKVTSLLPVIANRIAGQTIIPVPDQSFMLMANLLENLSSDQQMKMLNMLDPGQRILFGEMLAEYEKKKATVSGDKPNLLGQSIGKKNALPSGDEGAPKQLEDGNEGEVTDSSEPKPLFKTIEDRMKEPASIMGDDAVIQGMEQLAKDFASRFQATMKPTDK